MPTVTELTTLLEQAMETIAALQDQRPHHVHFCPQGSIPGTEHEWRCPNPYCEPPWRPNVCPKHGGAVRGAPTHA